MRADAIGHRLDHGRAASVLQRHLPRPLHRRVHGEGVVAVDADGGHAEGEAARRHAVAAVLLSHLRCGALGDTNQPQLYPSAAATPPRCTWRSGRAPYVMAAGRRSNPYMQPMQPHAPHLPPTPRPGRCMLRAPAC